MATHENTSRPPRCQQVHLSDSIVRRLDRTTPRIVYDTLQPGFGIRLSPTARSWVLNYSVAGRERRMTIGALAVWPSKAARARARELRQMIDRGLDPMQLRQAERAAPTIGELLDEYEQAAKAKRSWPDDKAMIATYIRPRWQHRKVGSITGDDVETLHLELTRAGKTIRANRVLSLLSTIFALALHKKWIADNPARGIRRNKETRRERYLTIEEIGRLVAVLDCWPDTRSAVAVKLLLLLGCRRGELLRARWREFDLVGMTWSKPAENTKSGKRHTIPLSAEAIAELEKLPRHNFCDLLFRNAAGNPWSEIAAWPAIRQAAGLGGVRLHDLRHSAASVLISQGLSLEVIGQLLGHAGPAMTARYSHLHDHVLRSAVTQLGRTIGGN